jgi:TyrR family helix-turn-helix protein
MALSKLLEIERERGKPMPEILQELFPKYPSQQKLAEELGVSQGSISLWMTRYGLKEKRVLVKLEMQPS